MSKNNDDAKLVKNLCESIGYGHVMALASALWMESMKEKEMPTTGVFLPVPKDSIKMFKRYRVSNRMEKYYSIVKEK
jgi:hypothetical protein